MDNDKDIEIKSEEDLGLDEKIKAGAKAVGRKIGDPESDIGSEDDTEKTIERVEDWENRRWIDRWIFINLIDTLREGGRDSTSVKLLVIW